MEVYLRSKVKSDIMSLYFSVPPEWVIEPKDTSVVAGHTVAQHCQADGFPLPTVIWRKGHGMYYCNTIARDAVTMCVVCLAMASVWCSVNLHPNLEDNDNFQAHPSSRQLTNCSCSIWDYKVHTGSLSWGWCVHGLALPTHPHLVLKMKKA